MDKEGRRGGLDRGVRTPVVHSDECFLGVVLLVGSAVVEDWGRGVASAPVRARYQEDQGRQLASYEG